MKLKWQQEGEAGTRKKKRNSDKHMNCGKETGETVKENDYI